MELWHWTLTAITSIVVVCYPFYVQYHAQFLKLRVDAIEASERQCQEDRKSQNFILDQPFPSDSTLEEIKAARIVLEKNGFICTNRQVAVMVENIKKMREQIAPKFSI